MHIEMVAYANVQANMDVGHWKREFSLQMNKLTEEKLHIPGGVGRQMSMHGSFVLFLGISLKSHLVQRQE